MSNEEYLQEQAESEKGDGSADSLAYRKVFSALKKDVNSRLPPGFADRVILLLEQKQSSRIFGLELILAVVGAIFLIIIAVTAVTMTGFKLDFGFMNAVSGYKGVFIFGVAFIALIHWLDKLVIRKKLSL